MTRPTTPAEGDERRDAAGRQRGAARAEGRTQRSSTAPSRRRKGSDPARTVAYDVLRSVAGTDSYANLVLPPLLRERHIDSRDAAFATELAYGTLRLQGRYDAVIALAANRPTDKIDPPALDVLRLGAHQLLGMRVPAHAAVSETVGLAREQLGTGASQFVNAVLRTIGREPLEVWEQRIAEAAGPDPLARLAVQHSHPLWVVRAMREALVANGRPADEIEELLVADNVAPHVTVVTRPGLAEPDEVIEDAADGAVRGAYAPTAVVLAGGDPAALASVRDGRSGVQDEGSQLVALALTAVPVQGRDERWLDLCAGPGGKAALLAAVAGGRGARLVANELQPHRTLLVEQALRAVPADAVEDVRTGDGRTLGTEEPAAFDRVLVDAPCTGLGALRRRPEARWRRSPTDLAPLSGLQRELLVSALRAVRPGGVVAYVTCSPHLVETQLVVKDALRTAERLGLGVEILDARAVVRGIVPGGAIELNDDRRDIQLWPHVHGTDAMHLTLLRRTS